LKGTYDERRPCGSTKNKANHTRPELRRMEPIVSFSVRWTAEMQFEKTNPICVSPQ
jgi:hypothetical protein